MIRYIIVLLVVFMMGCAGGNYSQTGDQDDRPLFIYNVTTKENLVRIPGPGNFYKGTSSGTLYQFR